MTQKIQMTENQITSTMLQLDIALYVFEPVLCVVNVICNFNIYFCTPKTFRSEISVLFTHCATKIRSNIASFVSTNSEASQESNLTVEI